MPMTNEREQPAGQREQLSNRDALGGAVGW